MLRSLFVLCIFTLLPFLGQSQPIDSVTILLYKGDIPNTLQTIPELTENRSKGGRFVSNTSIPTLTCYKTKGNARKAIIICPGGGYRGLAIDKEGFWVARVLQQRGIHAFVLKYRTPNDETCQDKSIAPLQDAQQALSLAKEQIQSWGGQNVDIGIMGFSAGGHLAALSSNTWDFDGTIDTNEETLNPDFSILIYPVITMEEPYAHMGSRKNLLGLQVSDQDLEKFSAHYYVNELTPPTFLMHASDDASVAVKNSLLYYEACLEHRVPVEMHLYANGGHGFGMINEKAKDAWMERLLNWLDNL